MFQFSTHIFQLDWRVYSWCRWLFWNRQQAAAKKKKIWVNVNLWQFLWQLFTNKQKIYICTNWKKCTEHHRCSNCLLACVKNVKSVGGTNIGISSFFFFFHFASMHLTILSSSVLKRLIRLIRKPSCLQMQRIYSVIAMDAGHDNVPVSHWIRRAQQLQ